MIHALSGCVRKGSRWVATCSCSWRSEPRHLPGQTYTQWVEHKHDAELVAAFPRSLP